MLFTGGSIPSRDSHGIHISVGKQVRAFRSCILLLYTQGYCLGYVLGDVLRDQDQMIPKNNLRASLYGAFIFYSSSIAWVPTITNGNVILVLEFTPNPFLISILILSNRNSAGLCIPGIDLPVVTFMTSNHLFPLL